MSVAWEPDDRSNFFFNSPVHLCTITYMTEILLTVMKNNQFYSLILPDTTFWTNLRSNCSIITFTIYRHFFICESFWNQIIHFIWTWNFKLFKVQCSSSVLHRIVIKCEYGYWQHRRSYCWIHSHDEDRMFHAFTLVYMKYSFYYTRSRRVLEISHF